MHKYNKIRDLCSICQQQTYLDAGYMRFSVGLFNNVADEEKAIAAAERYYKLVRSS